MANAHFEVVGVVRGRDLDRAGTERFVDVAIGDDGNLSADERKHDVLADERRVALVRRIDRDRGITQHGFGAGGRDYYELVAVLDRVFKMP